MQGARTIVPKVRLPGVLVIPVLAVSFGIVSVLLTGGVSPAPAPSPGGSSGGQLLTPVTLSDIGDLTVLMIGGFLVFWTILRLKGTSQSLTPHFLVVPLALTCIVLIFLVAVHLFVHGAIVPGSPAFGPGNHSGTPSGNTSRQGFANNSTNSLPTPNVPLPPGWPWWIPYAALGAAGIAIGALSVPFALARDRRASPLPLAVRRPSTDSAIRSALVTLEHGTDPRGSIIALYGQLLDLVGNRVGPIEPKTARELARPLVEGLGVSASVAQELTDRFEEARYSRRPLRPDAVLRTRDALTRAQEELARVPRRP
ncbi:MAG: DUF4129 domain-containing protein [Thermoplasmata archaeon]|nr:DUF4129 domain-containing protein [Thermoplasmata archaeon]MCI4359686.1 DUF4129 domain-containing protein [Thermoplasmata archaeon]